MYMYESLCCPPETVITLLISCSSSSVSYLVVSDSCQLQPTRFLCPRDSPGKNTGVDCHSAIFQYKIKSLIKKIIIMFGKHCKLGLSQATQDVGLFSLFKKVLVQSDSLAPHGLHASPCFGHHAPLFMGFSRQEYWSEQPLPSLEVLPDPGIESGSPALQADSLPSELPGRNSTLPFSLHEAFPDARNQNDFLLTLALGIRLSL